MPLLASNGPPQMMPIALKSPRYSEIRNLIAFEISSITTFGWVLVGNLISRNIRASELPIHTPIFVPRYQHQYRDLDLRNLY